MALSILNNISALTAQSQLSVTQTNLQKTLTQLSSGLKINSGADDAAGLSIANGLTANIAALTQSQQNANNGIGLLQTADGALSQVTSLLNRAVTLATEAANGGLTSAQALAVQGEYTQIMGQIDNIGKTTNFNGANVFGGRDTATWTGSTGGLTTATAFANGSTVSIYDSKTGGTFVWKAQAGANQINDLKTAVASATTSGTLSGTTADVNGTGNLEIKTATGGDTLTVTVSNGISAVAGSVNAKIDATKQNSADVFISDGTSGGNQTVTTNIQALSSSALQLGANALNTSETAASAELTKITDAINTIASQRGTIGANINQLNAANNIVNTQVQNLSSAQNAVLNADIGKTVANMTQYNILQSTGMAALQQANQSQQAVLKLLQ